MPRNTNPDATTPATTGPEPSIDTTKRQAPGPDTQRPLQAGQSAKQEKPKLPHERDESVDMTHGVPDAQMQQAYRDLQRGLQDTDKGPAADRAYPKQK